MLRIFLIAGAAVVALTLAAASYEAIASVHDAERYPAPGQLVDVGGYRLHLNCIGEGDPTVILDAGLGGSSLDWTLVQPELARTTRTCAFDRAGMGWSDAGPGRRTPDQLANELAVLLNRAHIDAPYVLVAHSLAGKNARLFAMHHPDDVVGMVLIDTRHEYVDEQTSASEQQAFLEGLHGQAFQYATARRLGVARLFGDQLAGVPSITRPVRREMALMATTPEALEATGQEGRERSASDDLLRGAPTLGDSPLVVLAAAQSMGEPRWAEGQRRLAALSSSGRLVVAQGSSHAVEWDDPELVIATVREVIAEVRSAGEAEPGAYPILPTSRSQLHARASDTRR